jgi:hypothetical protein
MDGMQVKSTEVTLCLGSVSEVTLYLSNQRDESASALLVTEEYRGEIWCEVTYIM